MAEQESIHDEAQAKYDALSDLERAAVDHSINEALGTGMVALMDEHPEYRRGFQLGWVEDATPAAIERMVADYKAHLDQAHSIGSKDSGLARSAG